MQAPFYRTIRNRMHVLTKKLFTEVLVSSLATLLVMAMFSNVMKTTTPAARADITAATAASDEKTADFMERVALSHVASLKAPATTPASEPAEPAAALAANAAAPAVAPTQLSGLRGHDRTRAAAVHVAANIPDVLPPPRPQLAVVEPAGFVAPQKARSHRVIDYGLRPLRFGMHVVTDVVDFVPASGTRVVEGVASVGDALTSFAKKL